MRPSWRKRTARSSAGRRRRIGGRAPRPLPRRTCVACRTERAKRELVRVVRAPRDGGLSVDPRGKASGRGAYLCADPACLERGLTQGSLARALEVGIDQPTGERLRRELEGAARMRVEASDA